MLWQPSRLFAGPRKGLHSAIVDRHTIRLPFPSWSWASWGSRVEYYPQCEKAVKGLVQWCQPVRYVVNPDNPFSTTWRQLTNYNDPSRNNVTTRSRKAIMDEQSLGFLRFTTACAKFDLEVEDLNLHERHPKDCVVCKEWAQCRIRAHTGKNLGSIRVPAS